MPSLGIGGLLAGQPVFTAARCARISAATSTTKSESSNRFSVRPSRRWRVSAALQRGESPEYPLRSLLLLSRRFFRVSTFPDAGQDCDVCSLVLRLC
uniref:Putative secreted protein n=1 Tax=Ixodes ricinus TaxID=34613 RepID=A0A6B0U4H6_IXORI